MVKNPPSNAEVAGSIPGGGTKIPACQGATKPGPQLERSQRAAMKSPPTAMKDPACCN